MTDNHSYWAAIVRRCRNWNRNSRFSEKSVVIFLWLSAMVSILTTLGIVWVLFKESLPFFSEVSLFEYLMGTQWSPLFSPQKFGVLPLICGTFLIAAGAAMVAIPFGVGTAIFLSEYASNRTRDVIKPVMEVLSGIPTVVYGYFALTFITPLLQSVIADVEVFNALSGAIVVGIMTIPMVASLSDDAMRAVPDSLRYAAYALGSTKFETSFKIVFPAALSGVIASMVLAVSRAIGETMAVTLASGATPKLTLNPLESIQTMTAYIVQVSLGDTPQGTIEYQTIFVIGLTLFVITLCMNIVSNKVLDRYKLKYEV
ncbi:MAG: phosphate ABC transporter permease subunit PstC [Bdellovibrionales bacterium]|nr:phosphate ABC transporter permease subunit PstC [Bdellovibrionales bacterium]